MHTGVVMRTLCLASCLACASTTTQVDAVPVRVPAEPRAEPERIRVVLERPSRVGHRHRVMRRSRQQRTRSVYEGETLSERPIETDQEVEMQAIATVMALDPDGGVSELQLVIERLVWSRGAPPDADATVLEPGVVVLLRRGDPGEFSIDGEPVYGHVLDALELAIDSTRDEDQDVLFGTPEPQPVGGQWSINAEAVAAALHSPRSPVAPENVSGTATLVAADADGYTVRATWHVETETDEPQVRRVVHGDGVVRYSSDPAVPPVEAELDLRQDWQLVRGNERIVSTSLGSYLTKRWPLGE